MLYDPKYRFCHISQASGTQLRIFPAKIATLDSLKVLPAHPHVDHPLVELWNFKTKKKAVISRNVNRALYYERI